MLVYQRLSPQQIAPKKWSEATRHDPPVAHVPALDLSPAPPPLADLAGGLKWPKMPGEPEEKPWF